MSDNSAIKYLIYMTLQRCDLKNIIILAKWKIN